MLAATLILSGSGMQLALGVPASAAATAIVPRGQVCGPTVDYVKSCTDDNEWWYPVIDGITVVADYGPRIDGAFVVGSTLTSIPTQYQVHDRRTLALPGDRFGYYQDPFGIAVTYRWLRDGEVIAGANAPKYTLTEADGGKRIMLSTRGSKADTLSFDLNSEPSPPVLPAGSSRPIAPAPTELTIGGDPRVGRYVFATSSNFDIDNNASRQWLRDGAPIPGATQYGYKPTLADLGKLLSMKVATYRFGFDSGSKISEPVVVGPGALGKFVDVGPEQQFAIEIQWMFDSGISTGWDDNTYRAGLSVNRDAMVAFMHRLARKPYVQGATKVFPDVGPDDQFLTEITWAATAKISDGYVDGTFRPVTAVSRDAMAAFMYRLAGSPDFAPPKTSPFVDVGPNDQFYKEITWMYDSKISTGWPDRTYRPLEPVKRDAMAAFLYRFRGLTS